MDCVFRNLASRLQALLIIFLLLVPSDVCGNSNILCNSDDWSSMRGSYTFDSSSCELAFDDPGDQNYMVWQFRW